MSEHAEAGKVPNLAQGGYQSLQVGDDENDSPQRTRIPNNGKGTEIPFVVAVNSVYK